MKVAIIGYEIDGRAAQHYFEDMGAEVTICDIEDHKHIPAGVEAQLGKDYLRDLGRFDVIVRSSGIHPSVLLKDNPGIEKRITTGISEFLRVCPTKNVIGITGTKGKGTTSSLTAKMLEAAGHKVFLGGNIGTSPLDFVRDITADDWVILELSSYQLFDIRYSPRLAVCLMVEPEHLTWHADYTDYKRAKSNLFRHQTAHDTAIYFADNEISHQIASTSKGKKIPYFAAPGAYVEEGAIVIDDTILCPVEELQLLGKHNWQNACAAATIVWQIIQAPDAIHQVLTTFTGLPHRLEFVRDLEGIRYFNDSFASAPPAAEAALQAVTGPKVVILGGYDRHLPLDKLVVTIKSHADDIRGLLLIGASAERLADEFKRADYTNFTLSTAKTMADIVLEANALAHSGDSVILSPGFPSFDMFKNFEDRGLQFKKEVNLL
jgi:UDP-N-acetylmuramoylalanine--D-glutamate ligase